MPASTANGGFRRRSVTRPDLDPHAVAYDHEAGAARNSQTLRDASSGRGGRSPNELGVELWVLRDRNGERQSGSGFCPARLTRGRGSNAHHKGGGKGRHEETQRLLSHGHTPFAITVVRYLE